MGVPIHDGMSQDNLSVKVHALSCFRVIVRARRSSASATTWRPPASCPDPLRSVRRKHELGEMLAERDELTRDIQQIPGAQTGAAGIKSPTQLDDCLSAADGPGRTDPRAA